MGITAAIIGSALIGGATSLYSAEAQKSAAKKDIAAREAAAKAERERLSDIERNTKPEGESLDEISYGSGDENDDGGSTSDFLVPKQTGSLGSSGRSGLGFKV